MKIFWLLLLLLSGIAMGVAQTNATVSEAPAVAPATNTPIAATNAATVAATVTNAPGTNVTTTTVRPMTKISSERAEVDVKTSSIIYMGNVRVEDPQMTMTCEMLTARAMTNGTKLESIVAQNNVVIDGKDAKGQTAHATANKLVYSYKVIGMVTNESIQLTGSPKLKDGEGRTFEGDPITWDITSGRIVAVGHTTGIPSPTNNATQFLEKLGPGKKQ